MMSKKNGFAVLIFGILLTACTYNQSAEYKKAPLAPVKHTDKDTLRVVTQYDATSYFEYNGDPMGYDYELALALAEHLNLPLSVYVVNSDDEITDLLRRGMADISIFNSVETTDLKQEFNFVFPQEESYMVLVQLVKRDAITDVNGLADKQVWVKKNSIYHKRLRTLNNETGGKIIIRFAPDSVSTDDLMLQVANGLIPFTLSFRHKALLQKRFSRQLDIRVPVGFNQRNGWLIPKSNKALTDTILSWGKLESTKKLQARLQNIYWLNNPYFAFKKVPFPKGAISPYDELFKQNAARIDWDWRLLAAVGYAESGFDSTAVSWAGARGVMQLMPGTALIYGVDSFDIENPAKNIAAGTEYIKYLDQLYQEIEDKEERIKFILASYNAGPARVLDAMALTKRYGKNPHIWFENTEFFLEKLDEVEFYRDSVVKYGSFGGTETLRYVPYVLDTYTRFVEKGATKEEKEKMKLKLKEKEKEKEKNFVKDSVIDMEKNKEKDTVKNHASDKEKELKKEKDLVNEKVIEEKEKESEKITKLEKENNEKRNNSD